VDYETVKRVLAALEKRHVHYAIFGAVALNLHGLARFTEDLDLFVSPDAGNVSRLKEALDSVFHDPEIENIRADELQGDYPAVQYVPPEGPFRIDILTRLGEVFRFEELETERVALEDLTVTVVTPRTLYRMKRGTIRLRDRADAEMLRERFKLEED